MLLGAETPHSNASFLAVRGSACDLPDAAHVKMGDLHNFGESIHTRGVSRVQLLLGNGTQGPHKLHNSLTVQLVTASPQQEMSQPCTIVLQVRRGILVAQTPEAWVYTTQLLFLGSMVDLVPKA